IEKISNLYPSHESQVIQQLETQNHRFTVRWIINSTDNTLEGGIFINGLGRKLHTWEKTALEQAAVITALEIERYKSLAITYRRLKNDFLLKLVNKNILPEIVIKKHSQELN